MRQEQLTSESHGPRVWISSLGVPGCWRHPLQLWQGPSHQPGPGAPQGEGAQLTPASSWRTPQFRWRKIFSHIFSKENLEVRGVSWKIYSYYTRSEIFSKIFSNLFSKIYCKKYFLKYCLKYFLYQVSGILCHILLHDVLLCLPGLPGKRYLILRVTCHH